MFCNTCGNKLNPENCIDFGAQINKHIANHGAPIENACIGGIETLSSRSSILYYIGIDNRCDKCRCIKDTPAPTLCPACGEILDTSDHLPGRPWMCKKCNDYYYKGMLKHIKESGPDYYIKDSVSGFTVLLCILFMPAGFIYLTFHTIDRYNRHRYQSVR